MGLREKKKEKKRGGATRVPHHGAERKIVAAVSGKMSVEDN